MAESSDPVRNSDGPLVHHMRLDEPYFQAMAAGRKRIELRVADRKRERIRAGDWIMFTCNGTNAELTVRVAAIRRYASFADLYQHEEATMINSAMSATDQLNGVRAIYQPQKEALGALAIDIALLT